MFKYERVVHVDIYILRAESARFCLWLDCTTAEKTLRSSDRHDKEHQTQVYLHLHPIIYSIKRSDSSCPNFTFCSFFLESMMNSIQRRINAASVFTGSFLNSPDTDHEAHLLLVIFGQIQSDFVSRTFFGGAGAERFKPRDLQIGLSRSASENLTRPPLIFHHLPGSV